MGQGKKLQIPRLPPDFLSGLVTSLSLVRLSFRESRIRVRWLVQRVGNPEFARDDSSIQSGRSAAKAPPSI